MKLKKLIYTITLGFAAVSLTTSCEDMLDKGNNYVIYDKDHILDNPADTATSVLGILNKLQAISVRTNLLGEVRADLVKVNSNALTDLKNLAEFEANVTGDDDPNIYNVPRDYYAVINNCNYFLAYADSTAGNTNRNEKYFEAEIAQVHSIRAWTYLQLVLAYGRVPLVTEPVLTKIQSDAEYPMVGLEEICDYFINDLKPYYGKAYPDYVNIGGDIDPQLCFFPSQVVTGDLYLYKAVLQGQGAGAESAKAAAKAYYDYIVWDQSGKKRLFTQNRNASWPAGSLYQNMYSKPNSLGWTVTATWASAAEPITSIPMDSAAADGYYNELRNLYNMTNHTELKEASIAPSDYLKELSQSQDYYGYDTYKNVVHVTKDKFTDEQLDKYYLGDLRFQSFWRQETMKWNGKEIDQQAITKHSGQHVGIYRAQQLYLRLAEALNYAGYPRFAKQILTMGLSNTVIKYEVSPYYTSESDSSFIAYFDFNDNDFKPYAENYMLSLDSLHVAILKTSPSLRNVEEVNMQGIHSRGSGLAFLNPGYCAFAAPDSSAFPHDLAAKVGREPMPTDYEYPTAPTEPRVVKEPTTWAKYGNVVVTEEQYMAVNPGAKNTAYKKYVDNDSVAKYNTYITETLPAYETEYAQYQKAYDAVVAEFKAEHEKWDGRLHTYKEAYDEWMKGAYSDATLIKAEQEIVDKAILDEQALELAYEGNRFFDLMRRCYWYNDNSILVNAVSRRTPAATKLADRNNWFLNWKGKIGM